MRIPIVVNDPVSVRLTVLALVSNIRVSCSSRNEGVLHPHDLVGARSRLTQAGRGRGWHRPFPFPQMLSHQMIHAAVGIRHVFAAR